jgi:hypothetical protein
VAILGIRNASETFEYRHSNASNTLDQHPTCSPRCVHPLLEASWPVCKVLWSTTSACASMRGSLTPDLPPYLRCTFHCDSHSAYIFPIFIYFPGLHIFSRPSYIFPNQTRIRFYIIIVCYTCNRISSSRPKPNSRGSPSIPN